MTMNISTSGGLTRVFSIFILSTFLPFLKISENNIKPLWTYLKYSFSCHRVWGDTQDIIKRNPANIRLGKDVLKTSSRRLQDVFSVTFFCLPRRLEDIIARRLANTSWRRFRKTYCKYVLKTSWKTKSVTLKTSSRRLGKQEMFAGKPYIIHNLYLSEFAVAGEGTVMCKEMNLCFIVLDVMNYVLSALINFVISEISRKPMDFVGFKWIRS